MKPIPMALIAIAAVLAAGCASNGAPASGGKLSGDLSGEGSTFVAFLHYVLHDGQALNTPNRYAPMPASVVAKADAIVETIG